MPSCKEGTEIVRNRFQRRAINSAVECHLHTVEVTGSIPVSPTRQQKKPPASRLFFCRFRNPHPGMTGEGVGAANVLRSRAILRSCIFATVSFKAGPRLRYGVAFQPTTWRTCCHVRAGADERRPMQCRCGRSSPAAARPPPALIRMRGVQLRALLMPQEVRMGRRDRASDPPVEPHAATRRQQTTGSVR